MLSGDDYSKIQTFISQKTQGSRYSNCATHFLVWLVKQDLRTSKNCLEFPEHFVESHFFPDKRKKKISYSMSTVRKARAVLVESRLIQTFYVKNKNAMFAHWNTHYYIINYELLEKVLNRNVDKTYNQYYCEFDGLHKTWKDIKLNKEVQMKQTKLEIDSNNKDVQNLQKENKKLLKENENLKKMLYKRELLLRRMCELPTSVKYVVDNYKELYEKELKILEIHGQIATHRNLKDMCNRLIAQLEGTRYQKIPNFTVRGMNNYFDLILQFSFNEYSELKYAPRIKSDIALFSNRDQIVKELLKAKPNLKRPMHSGFEKSVYEPVAEEDYKEFEDDDEPLDLTGIDCSGEIENEYDKEFLSFLETSDGE